MAIPYLLTVRINENDDIEKNRVKLCKFEDYKNNAPELFNRMSIEMQVYSTILEHDPDTIRNLFINIRNHEFTDIRLDKGIIKFHEIYASRSVEEMVPSYLFTLIFYVHKYKQHIVSPDKLKNNNLW